MHEFSICQNIVKLVLKEYEKLAPQAGKLLKTRIVVGKMHQIVPQSLQFAYEVLTRDTPAADSQLEIILKPVKVICKECNWQGEINDSLFLCRSCEKANVEIVTGKELYIQDLEVAEQ